MEVMEEASQGNSDLQGDNTKIDMSLDDIIKLQKEESDTQPSSNQDRLDARIRNRNFRNKRFFRGPPRNQQGSGRLKSGFKQQRFSRTNTRNASFGPVTRNRAAASFSGVSPLHRPNTSTSSSQNRGQAQSQKARQITRKYKAPAGPVQMITRRNNSQNRTLQFRAGQGQQRTNAVNENRRQFTLNRGKKQLNTRWQNKEGFGTTLTVSVLNLKGNQGAQNKNVGPPRVYQALGTIKPGMKQPGGRFRKTGFPPSGSPPKGVPLRFNFRAMANHTNVTLNERFSSLKIKGQFTPARRGGRTVTLA
ncbi:UAP56-interacting factor-like isoform X2 [Pyxicephalus adspersus]|uniref:UAP56-interacting factor-like isoform X2 n=1 Tax=Pyxicephalus adspersus TaxID=30357 RepID=UPI003B5CE8E5